MDTYFPIIQLQSHSIDLSEVAVLALMGVEFLSRPYHLTLTLCAQSEQISEQWLHQSMAVLFFRSSDINRSDFHSTQQVSAIAMSNTLSDDIQTGPQFVFYGCVTGIFQYSTLTHQTYYQVSLEPIHSTVLKQKPGPKIFLDQTLHALIRALAISPLSQHSDTHIAIQIKKQYPKLPIGIQPLSVNHWDWLMELLARYQLAYYFQFDAQALTWVIVDQASIAEHEHEDEHEHGYGNTQMTVEVAPASYQESLSLQAHSSRNETDLACPWQAPLSSVSVPVKTMRWRGEQWGLHAGQCIQLRCGSSVKTGLITSIQHQFHINGRYYYVAHAQCLSAPLPCPTIRACDLPWQSETHQARILQTQTQTQTQTQAHKEGAAQFRHGEESETQSDHCEEGITQRRRGEESETQPGHCEKGITQRHHCKEGEARRSNPKNQEFPFNTRFNDAGPTLTLSDKTSAAPGKTTTIAVPAVLMQSVAGQQQGWQHEPRSGDVVWLSYFAGDEYYTPPCIIGSLDEPHASRSVAQTRPGCSGIQLRGEKGHDLQCHWTPNEASLEFNVPGLSTYQSDQSWCQSVSGEYSCQSTADWTAQLIQGKTAFYAPPSRRVVLRCGDSVITIAADQLTFSARHIAFQH